MNVYARWRPLPDGHSADDLIDHQATSAGDASLFSISINAKQRPNDKPWTSTAAYKSVLSPADDNAIAYTCIAEPSVVNALAGGSSSFFAYGHSGSGKTHTIIGYDYQDSNQLGLCLASAQQLFSQLEQWNQTSSQPLGLGLSLFELRHKKAYDLLNNRVECHVRQGHDGKTHIRGETETLEGGKVRVRPVTKLPCWTLVSFTDALIAGLARRSIGTSTIHDESSRTHAVLELEIINQPLVEAREALIERESELVPVGKHATDVKVSEQTKGIVMGDDGKWKPNPDYQVNQALIDECDAALAKFEAAVADAESLISTLYESTSHKCLGGKLLFIDLAGAEYQDDKSNPVQSKKQSPKERQEARQINTDLLALKEVIRAWTGNKPRIPFRSSTLTMVLRELFLSSHHGNSGMIVTVSPAKSQYAATVNSLKYGSLVGTAA